MAKAAPKTKVQELAEKVESTAKKTFLAGLGVYSRTADEAKSRFEKLSTDSEKLFGDLAKDGEGVQTDLEKRVSDVKGKVEAKYEEVKGKLLEVPYFSISSKLDEVSSKLDKLAKA